MIDVNRVRSRSRPGAGERAAGQERQTVFVVVFVALVLKTGEKSEPSPDTTSGRRMKTGALERPIMKQFLLTRFPLAGFDCKSREKPESSLLHSTVIEELPTRLLIFSQHDFRV
jgi:hypothetical protein